MSLIKRYQKICQTNYLSYLLYSFTKYTTSRVIINVCSLKLCNFYFDENNNVKLGDFGFACKLANDNDKKR
jgi:serine/threonine protein kinase